MPSPSSLWCLLLLAGLCCLLPVSQAKDPHETEASDPDYKFQEQRGCWSISDTLMDRFLSLYRKTARRSKLSSILLSPVSIASAFTMLSLGTKGDTHMQILEGLRFNRREMPEAHVHQCFRRLLLTLLHPDHQLQLTMGSSLFIHESLKPVDQFVQDVEELYHAEVISVNFTDAQVARNQINSRVERETRGEIVDLVSDLQEGTALVLASYISFHGKLHEELLQELVVEEYFQVHKKRAIIVPMVRRLGRFYVQWYPRLSSWVLVQHYVSDGVAFFIMPNLGKMQQLERRVTCDHLDAIQRHIGLRFVNLFFPKLSMSGAHDLKSLLGTLGITKVFSRAADLSGITEEAPVKLSKAVHRVLVTLDEKTEDIEVDEDSKRFWVPIPTICFNRSFLIIIKDEFTNFPLLVGRVLDPTQH